MKQANVTAAMGKRLIGKGMATHPDIQTVLEEGKLVIIAGTTNGYVAEEILASIGQAEGFSRAGFRRGVTVPSGEKVTQVEFPGDVVIVDGQWQKGKLVTDVAGDLKTGDVVLKGANAFDPGGQAAVQIGHHAGGTIMSVLPAVYGRRVRLIVPVGLEKRVFADVNILAAWANAPETEGPRLLPMPGEVFTEMDAIELLTGAEVILLAAGGVHGAEGSAWLGIDGSDEEIAAAAALIRSVAREPSCRV